MYMDMWLLWPGCCVVGVRLVVPGCHLTMGHKTPPIPVFSVFQPLFPALSTNSLPMRLNNSLTAVCLPFVIGEAFAFAFCLCSSMYRVFASASQRFMEIVQYFQ